MNRLSTRPAVLAAAAITFSTLSTAHELAAQTLFSPMSRGSLDGSSSTSFPLGRHDMRLQQLHDDVSFSDLPVIAGHAYRRDAVGTRGMVDTFQVDMEVQLSLAPVPASSPSATFANNRGAQPVTVLPRTVLTFPAVDRPGTAPAPNFDYVIPYAVPFVRPSVGTLCLETVIYGNQAPSGPDRNFNTYLDAHELESDGSTRQLGYRFGDGCTSAAQTRSHEARFEFYRTPTDLVLTIDSRFGVPTTSASTPAFTALVLGTGPQAIAWPALNGCSTYTTGEVIIDLPGSPDPSGDFDITYAGLDTSLTGLELYLQLVSGDVMTADYSMSDGTYLTVPDLEAAPLQASRIAASTDHTAATGTVSFNVPVTMFF